MLVGQNASIHPNDTLRVIHRQTIQFIPEEQLRLHFFYTPNSSRMSFTS